MYLYLNKYPEDQLDTLLRCRIITKYNSARISAGDLTAGHSAAY